jgi:hypothetical protein
MNASSISKVCPDCGDVFFVAPEEGWKRRCFRCWRSDPHRSQPDATVKQLHDKLAQSQAEIDRLQRELARAGRGRATGLAGLDTRKWRWLAQTTHPDHHGGSPMATEIMAWLNAIRPR